MMIVNKRRLALAYGIEGGVVATSLVAAGLYAVQYGRDGLTITGMMVAPMIYALIELARVPMAGVVRTSQSFLVKLLASVAILAAAAITAKSVSQMGEMQFRPRLEEVSVKRGLRDEAKANLDAVTNRIAQLTTLVESRQQDLTRLNQQLVKITDERTATATKTKPYAVRLADGRVVWRSPPDHGVNKNLNDRSSTLVSEQKGLQAELEKTRAELSSLDRASAEKQLGVAQKDYAHAIQNSQLHHFAGMIFGLDPAQIGDDRIALVMRIFVLIPAIFAGIIATVLALSAYSYPNEQKQRGRVSRAIRAWIARRRKHLSFHRDEHERLANFIKQSMQEAIDDANRDALQPPSSDTLKKAA